MVVTNHLHSHEKSWLTTIRTHGFTSPVSGCTRAPNNSCAEYQTVRSTLRVTSVHYTQDKAPVLPKALYSTSQMQVQRQFRSPACEKLWAFSRLGYVSYELSTYNMSSHLEQLLRTLNLGGRCKQFKWIKLNNNTCSQKFNTHKNCQRRIKRILNKKPHLVAVPGRSCCHNATLQVGMQVHHRPYLPEKPQTTLLCRTFKIAGFVWDGTSGYWPIQ